MDSCNDAFRAAEGYAVCSCLEETATGMKSAVFGVSACMLLAGSILFGHQQERDLSGIHGIPVEGHDIVAGIEIRGTKHLDSSRSGWQKFGQRLKANGAELRLGGRLKAKRCVASRRCCET